ncbi:hypothetical protein LB553_29425 [Mesorhizobium sp. CA8]|nr:hypothetical protein [Mesorhizobium sp. CA8]MBZ9823503.1 hypothetical protein [Mesorhizobium sp. CA4]
MVEAGSSEQIFRGPNHPYTKLLLSARWTTPPRRKRRPNLIWPSHQRCRVARLPAAVQSHCPIVERRNRLLDSPATGTESPAGEPHPKA